MLEHSRGVFLKNIPANSTVASIVKQIRGGRIERVDFINHQNRTCVGIFFVLAIDAERFIKYVRRLGGVYWNDNGKAMKGVMVSAVEVSDSRHL